MLKFVGDQTAVLDGIWRRRDVDERLGGKVKLRNGWLRVGGGGECLFGARII